MRRRGVVNVLLAATFLLTLGSLAFTDASRPQPVSAPVAAGLLPVGPGPRNDGPEPTTPGTPPRPSDDSTQPRPPTDIPLRPISFIRQPRPTNGVALTIDDGPHPTWTPQVLDLLAQYNVRATFCLVGEQVRRYPELVRRIVADGHTLCDHSWDHDEQLGRRSPEVIERELRNTYDAIVEATGGIKPIYYRAPGGNWSTSMIDEARALGMVCLNWSVDPADWSRPGTDKIVSLVLKNTAPGDVVLMHDGGGDRSQSLQALNTLLPRLQARGYTFITP